MESAKEILLLFVRKLGEAISWIGSKTKSFFNSLSERINQSLHSARRFFDNFPEEFKQAVLEIKKSVDEGISKVGEILCSVNTLRLSATETVESNFILLVKMMKMTNSLVREMKILIGLFGKFAGYENEMKSRTKQRYKSSTDSSDSQTLEDLFGSMLRVFRLFLILTASLKEPSSKATV